MYAYRRSPAGGRYERVVLVSGWERFCEGVVRLVVEIVAWVYCGWSGTPYPESLKS